MPLPDADIAPTGHDGKRAGGAPRFREGMRLGASRYSGERRPSRRRKNIVAPAPEPGPRVAWWDVEGFAYASGDPGSGAGAT